MIFVLLPPNNLYLSRTSNLIVLLPFQSQTKILTRYFSKPLLPAILLVFSIVLTIIAWYISRNHFNDKTRDRFEYKVNAIHSAVQIRMSAYEQVLRSAVGLFYATDTITRIEWKTFVETLQLEKFYPGIQGLGYTIRLAPTDVDRFTKKVSAEGFPTFNVWPQTPREEYFPILFLEPFEGRNLRAFGYDMYTEQNRRQAMLRASKTGEPALSHMVVLVQEINKDVQKGCLLYLPVYNQQMKVSTVEERQAALKGFVYSPFRINDLMKGIIGSEEVEIEFEIYDGGNIDTSHLFYASHGYNHQKSKADFSIPRKLHVGGHNWTLVFTTRDIFLSSYEANQPNIIAVAGVLVNLLLLLILVQVYSLSKRNRVLAERYKAEKDRYEIVSESTNEIIWEWNMLTNMVSFNKIFPLIIGARLPNTALSFEQWISYLHPEDKDRVVNKMKSLINADTKLWTDEYRLIQPGGTVIDILARGQLIHHSDGTPVSMVGSMVNITERKQVEDAQRRFKEELERTVQQRTIELQSSNEDLERFAHVTSHDLREPVRKILFFIDLLKVRYQNSLGDGVGFLNKLFKSATRLNQMIEGILAISTVNYESNKAESVDLNTIVQNVADDLELIVREKQAQLIFQPLPAIEGSSVLLHQLFYNLINNALKFSKAGVQPIITIEFKDIQTGETEGVEIKVTDNGIGFDQDKATKIFQRFLRLHAKDKYEGTGLGLALCMRIVERHRGTIEATSSLGEGATFIIRLPKKSQSGII